MRIAVFGGSGKAGTAVLREALDRGHEVRALVRTPSKLELTHARLHVVPGGFEDTPALDHTLAGAEAAITSIGITSRARPTLLVDSVRAIRAGMQRNGVKRLIIVQGVHLPFPGDPHNPGLRAMKTVLGVAMRPLVLDGHALARLLAEDPGDWTVVRMPRLTIGPSTTGAITGRLRVSPLSTVTSSDVAVFALDCLERGEHVRQMPMIASTTHVPRVNRSRQGSWPFAPSTLARPPLRSTERAPPTRWDEEDPEAQPRQLRSTPRTAPANPLTAKCH